MSLTPERRAWSPIFLLILIFVATSVHADSISWALYSQPCKEAKKSSKVTVEGGAYGVFYFGPDPIVGCPADRIAGCKPRLQVYPNPGPSPMDGALACGPPSGCGKSFSQLTGESWIYIMDFLGWHGIAVDYIIRNATDPTFETLIAPLTPLFKNECPDVTDVDVVVNLARLAEAIDDGGTPPPTVINMSFGRKWIEGDATNAQCDLDGPCDTALSCQIARLIEHITRSEGPGPRRGIALAAHGNHQAALVPSAFDEVIDVGMIDLTVLGRSGEAQPAFETPSGPDGLMPGSGMCLRLPHKDSNMVHERSTPAGSSFSVAVAAGLVADAWLHHPQQLEPLLGSGQWTPAEVCESKNSCEFRLKHSTGMTFRSPYGAGSDRIYEATTKDASQCGDYTGGTVFANIEPSSLDPYEHYESLVERVARAHRTAPNSRPCGPCQGCCASIPAQGGSELFKSARGLGSVDNTAGTLVDWVIDLHDDWFLYVRLIDFYLRIGDETYYLNFPNQQVSSIDWGLVDFLAISGWVHDPNPSHHPSLVAILEVDNPDTGDPEAYWNSTPITWR